MNILRDEALAARVYPQLLAAADRMFWNMAPGAILGPFAHVLGDLATLLGRDAEAQRHYADANAFLLRLGATALISTRNPNASAGTASAGNTSKTAAAGGNASAGLNTSASNASASNAPASDAHEVCPCCVSMKLREV